MDECRRVVHILGLLNLTWLLDSPPSLNLHTAVSMVPVGRVREEWLTTAVLRALSHDAGCYFAQERED